MGREREREGNREMNLCRETRVRTRKKLSPNYFGPVYATVLNRLPFFREGRITENSHQLNGYNGWKDWERH